jgi:hypothetical protein
VHEECKDKKDMEKDRVAALHLDSYKATDHDSVLKDANAALHPLFEQAAKSGAPPRQNSPSLFV